MLQPTRMYVRFFPTSTIPTCSLNVHGPFLLVLYVLYAKPRWFAHCYLDASRARSMTALSRVKFQKMLITYGTSIQ